MPGRSREIGLALFCRFLFFGTVLGAWWAAQVVEGARVGAIGAVWDTAEIVWRAETAGRRGDGGTPRPPRGREIGLGLFHHFFVFGRVLAGLRAAQVVEG